jgi:hypothetical protein
LLLLNQQKEPDLFIKYAKQIKAVSINKRLNAFVEWVISSTLFTANYFEIGN